MTFVYAAPRVCRWRVFLNAASRTRRLNRDTAPRKREDVSRLRVIVILHYAFNVKHFSFQLIVHQDIFRSCVYERGELGGQINAAALFDTRTGFMMEPGTNNWFGIRKQQTRRGGGRLRRSAKRAHSDVRLLVTDAVGTSTEQRAAVSAFLYEIKRCRETSSRQRGGGGVF
jgi:hypothetical protein